MRFTRLVIALSFFRATKGWAGGEPGDAFRSDDFAGRLAASFGDEPATEPGSDSVGNNFADNLARN